MGKLRGVFVRDRLRTRDLRMACRRSSRRRLVLSVGSQNARRLRSQLRDRHNSKCECDGRQKAELTIDELRSHVIARVLQLIQLDKQRAALHFRHYFVDKLSSEASEEIPGHDQAA